MNVIISNKNKEILDKLDIEVIKRLDGEYSVDEIIDVFQNFFFNKMIVDITALKDYSDMRTIQKFSISFDMNKVIFLLDPSVGATPDYLSKLISMGIYNFTTNLEGLVYLYSNPNSYRDVAQYHKLDSMIITDDGSNNVNNNDFDDNSLKEDVNNEPVIENFVQDSNDKKGIKKRVFGFKSVTPGAGSTTLIYLLKKQLEKKYNVLAVEIEKRDFIYYNDKTLLSLSSGVIGEVLNTNNDKDVILVDLNGSPVAENFCTDVFYLIEPSIIKINRLLSIKPKILNELKGKKVVLCPSMLSSKDVKDFEYEANLKVYYNLPPIDDHSKSDEISKFISKLGI